MNFPTVASHVFLKKPVVTLIDLIFALDFGKKIRFAVKVGKNAVSY